MSCSVTVCKAASISDSAQRHQSRETTKRSETREEEEEVGSGKEKKKNGEFGLNSFVDGLHSNLHNNVLLSQTTAVLTSGLERIPDQLGYLVISEDGVLAVSAQIMFVDRVRRDLGETPVVLSGGVT